MTEQEIMREMLKKGIHSLTIQQYQGSREKTFEPVDYAREFKQVYKDEIEWLKGRVDDVIESGRRWNDPD